MKPAANSHLAATLFGSSPERSLALLRAVWSAAVGAELARRTQVLALDGQVLRIRVPDAGWRRGIVRVRGEILSRLRQLAGPVAPRMLGIVEGHVPAPGPEPPAEPHPAPTPPPLLRAAADAIGDPDLRERFLSSAASYLERFRPGAPPGSAGPRA
jgi:hypothetical protein